MCNFWPNTAGTTKYSLLTIKDFPNPFLKPIFRDSIIHPSTMASDPVDAAKEKALSDYRKKLLEHREIESRLRTMRDELKSLAQQYDKSENDLKALQSVGQIVGEVLKQLTEEKFIVKATNGPR